jgi:hypothetical protein
MDFHAAMETFAEAWVAANTPTAVNASEVRNSLSEIEMVRYFACMHIAPSLKSSPSMINLCSNCTLFNLNVINLYVSGV